MENKNDDGADVGCLSILTIIILIVLGYMIDEHKEQTYAIKDEIRQLRTKLEYRR